MAPVSYTGSNPTQLQWPDQCTIYYQFTGPAFCTPPQWGCDAGYSWDPFYCQCMASPVLLTLERNGFRLTSIDGGVDFDLNGDGMTERVSWTARDSDDAFLWLDRNANGVVDGGHELFGGVTPMSWTVSGPHASHGFEALGWFDLRENGGAPDGWIDSSDAVFGLLRLWRDSNHDGVSQSDEILTLSQARVQRISLELTESRRRDQYGNLFRYSTRAVPERQWSTCQPVGLRRIFGDETLTVFDQEPTMTPSQVMGTALLIAVLSAVGAAQQKPPTEVPVVLHYVDVPRTLEHATSRAQVIVGARIADAQPRTRMRPGVSVPDVSTAYKLDVVEVLKRDPQVPFPTEVLRRGGDLVTDKGTQRFVEEGFQVFQPKEEYLLFLFWNEYLGTYEMAFGPDAAFRITADNRLHAVGQGLFSQEHTAHDLRDVGSRIREIVARRNK